MYKIYMRKTTKLLMKEIKDKLNQWRDIPYSHIGRLSIINMSVLFNLIYKFSAISTKIPASYFVDINKLILKYMWKGKRPRIANTEWKKNKFGGLTLPNFRTCYKAAVIQTV